MDEKYINVKYIEKLGHKIQEIRERALFHIISKLSDGYTFENDVGKSRELLAHLFRWFLFEPCTHEVHVLNLIRKLIVSDTGKLLVNHLGKSSIQLEIDKIKTYINPQYLPELNEMQLALHNIIDNNRDVPPLKHEFPLSCRSDSEELFLITGSTATETQGYVQQTSSFLSQIGNNDIYVILKWQPLIETDRNVLLSVENSLSTSQNLSALFHSCEFFKNVLLHDFPAEIFLQRPGLILIFYDYLQTCHSTQLTNIILICLYKLTKELQKRINHNNIPCMQNMKTDAISNIIESNNGISSNTSENSIKSINSEHYNEDSQDTASLQQNQIHIPYYCFQTMKVVLKALMLKKQTIGECKLSLNQLGVNTSLKLLNELHYLLCEAVTNNLWQSNPGLENLKIFKELTNTLSIFGDSLEFFRIESLSMEATTKYRLTYLYLLSICSMWLNKFIPLSNINIFPKNFKVSISNSLLDVSISSLFPKMHNCLLEYVVKYETFSTMEEKDGLKKYQDVRKVCDGLSATVLFQNHVSGLNECIHLVEKALPSLQFHKSEQFLEKVINIISSELYKQNDLIRNKAHDIILKLLAHRDVEIQRKVYELCHKKIIDNIGTKVNLSSSRDSGARTVFLFNSDILIEIAVFGLNNKNIKQYAEDILMYILKCKLIISQDLWKKCLEVLVPTLPFILCYANNISALGRLITNLVDPDTSKSLLIPDIVMLKCNIQLLFSHDSHLRDEAFSRLCWLMASQENSREILPKFNTIYDKALSNICNIKNIIDINKLRKTEHFYQPSSLNQVLEVLKSPNVEPVIRRSALNQVSVMMEDHLLHEIFLESNGITLILDIMKTSLKEKDFRDYPDSIIPIISILKSISLYHSSIRQSLSTNIDVLYYTLRGIFLFFTDDIIRQDGSILLFSLIFKDFIIGSPSTANFAIPVIFSKHLFLPIKCIFYMFDSSHLGEDIYTTIVKDKWSLSSIQVQWNGDKLGGIKNLIKMESVELLNDDKLKDADVLKLTDFDLNKIKLSSIQYCIKTYLDSIQNATSHNEVDETISVLISYLNLYANICNFNNEIDYKELLAHSWEKTFNRFLEILPSSQEDIKLLSSVLKMLICLVPFYKKQDNCWISDFVKNPKHCLLDLLIYDYNKEEEMKNLSQELLNLITLCVLREYHYLEHYNVNVCKKSTNIGWNPLIKIISDNLVQNNTQHFYNLAYLDAFLSCLVHLTASLGWTNCISYSTPEEPIPQMISSLCELLTAFHCGKGPTAAISVMGLSISRNVLLVLNHILGEIQYSKYKNWENCFFDDINFTRSILALWASRDIVLRAAAVQFFTNLAISPKAVKYIINDLMFDSGNIWELAFSVLIDHSEASIVRENATLLLTNIMKNLFLTGDSKISTLLNITSNNTESQSPRDDILSLVDEYDLYSHIDIMLSSFFMLNYTKTKQDDNNSKETFINITTPGFINAICVFLYNLVELDPNSICSKLQERKLVVPIFRTLCNPMMCADDNRSLDLYCNLLEMNTNVCSVLKKISCLNPICLRTILYSDCLVVMFELLNSKLYHAHLPVLIYLRNKLWSEIFDLCTVLLEQLNEENKISPKSVESANNMIECIMSVGVETFFDCLCESLSCLGSSNLQQSALQFLISFLRIESYNLFENANLKLKEYSLKVILNTVATSRKVMMSSITDNIENVEPLQQFDKDKRNLLEKVYFGKSIELPKNEYKDDEIEVSFVSNNRNTLLAGSELCKILLYLFEISSIKTDKNQQWAKKKSMVTLALASLVGLSEEAKNYALENGLMEIVVKELRNYHINLSLESVESLRKIQDKKRLCPVLKSVDELIGVLTNFMINCEKVKLVAIDLAMADVIHKLWTWFLIQNVYIVNVLRLLCVYTKDCKKACLSLSLTSAVSGSGLRKTPSNTSLLHAVIAIIIKEMDQISRTHNLINLNLAFDVLQNCTDVLECRVLISKSNLFLSVTKLHPAVTKRQFPWDKVELLWLTFLQSFTRYPEGQMLVDKVLEILELILSLTSSNKIGNREMAMLVLRNLAFYQPNRARLLSSGDFLNILQSKLIKGTIKEKKTTVLTIWTLAANNQKAKLIFKSVKLDIKLENILKHSKLLGNKDCSFESDILDMIEIVLDILRGTDKVK